MQKCRTPYEPTRKSVLAAADGDAFLGDPGSMAHRLRARLGAQTNSFVHFLHFQDVFLPCRVLMKNCSSGSTSNSAIQPWKKRVGWRSTDVELRANSEMPFGLPWG